MYSGKIYSYEENGYQLEASDSIGGDSGYRARSLINQQGDIYNIIIMGGWDVPHVKS